MIKTIATLAACGNRHVSGNISATYMNANHIAASPQLYSCIQQIANQSLSDRDQTHAAAFFANPQHAQDIRQSNNHNNKAF